MSDITELSIAELSQGFRGKSLSPVDATKAYFARIAKHNDKVNAFVTLCEEDALAEARQAEQEISAGNYRGPMHGLPVAVKDQFFTKGIRTTGGSNILKDLVPDEDATVLQQVQQDE